MRRRLSSPRFRRRLFWTTGTTGVVSAIVVTAILLGNTGHSNETPVDRTKPAWRYRPPPKMALTSHDRDKLFVVATRFVRTAVARKNIDTAWDLLAPEMKAGQTRKSFDTGFNNVVPFAADGIESWSINYAYLNDVALDLSLFHRGSGSNWSGKTFTIELKRDLKQAGHPWLVASWVPKGIGGGGTLNPNRRTGPPPPPVKAHVSSKWLLLPAACLGLLLVALAGWAFAGFVRSRRAARRYAEALGYSSSTKPS